MRAILILLVLLLVALAVPVQAALPLRLEASTSRSEFTAGDRFTVAAHLFNDGNDPVDGQITIAAPKGFVALTPETATDTIDPGRALGASFGYQVAGAPLGLSRFVVHGNGLTQVVAIRVGPVVAPPAQRPVWRVYLPVFF